jgi:hypothetical protein
VKVRSDSNDGGERKEGSWRTCVLGVWELGLQSNLRPLKIEPGRDLKNYLVPFIYFKDS